jgi:hypothetical protein
MISAIAGPPQTGLFKSDIMIDAPQELGASEIRTVAPELKGAPIMSSIISDSTSVSAKIG